MKVASSFYDLTVGTKVFREGSEFVNEDEGVVINTQNNGEIVTVAWVGERVITDYDEATYEEKAFTAYRLV